MKATIKKVKTAQQIGEYKTTDIDTIKANADILLLSYSAPFYIDSNVDIEGEGIRETSISRRYIVTKNALKKLKSKYTCMTNY